MDRLYVDDSRQLNPTRPGMAARTYRNGRTYQQASLVAWGGLRVPGANADDLEAQLDELCRRTGFPMGHVGMFKWSPSRRLWMHNNLRDDAREKFLIDVLALCTKANARAIVVVSDVLKQPANAGFDSEVDTVALALERFHYDTRQPALMMMDTPKGGRAEKRRFLEAMRELRRSGTRYTFLNSLDVRPTASRDVRLLQAADVVTGCTLSTIAGETRFAPRIFEAVRPLLRRHVDRIGGAGLKIHPDYLYANLYHWLLGDDVLWKYGLGRPLPDPRRPYARGPFDY